MTGILTFAAFALGLAMGLILAGLRPPRNPIKPPCILPPLPPPISPWKQGNFSHEWIVEDYQKPN